MVSAGALSLAILAGALAAFNPCGFALLPAYLVSLVVDREIRQSKSELYRRALKFTSAMTLGFIAVFGSFATLISPFTGSISRYLPILTELVGLVLLAVGIALLRGRSFTMARVWSPNIAPTNAWRTQIGYGVTFALASLSCTIGPFLAITATAVQTKNVLKVIILFSTYALGMGIVVLILALLVATAQNTWIKRIRNSQKLIGRIGGVLLIAVGLYEAWYGWYEIRILRGGNSADPVINFAIRIQSQITSWVANLGSVTILLGGAVAALGLAGGFLLTKMHSKSVNSEFFHGSEQ
jgi:cytochrome c-type biogenesis protein